MNEYLSKLIELGKMVGGKIYFDQGFAFFERLPQEKLEELPEQERAYATTAMGRAVFQIGENGKVINYKGVDSHLDNNEAGLINKVGAEPINFTKDGEDYVKSTYPLNLVLFLGNDENKLPDIRIRGASPLEDLEIEAEVNFLMKRNEIKVPTIKQIKEFPQELLEKLHLPKYIDGSFEEFSSDYELEDIARKSYIKALMLDNYKEEKIDGKRPEKLSEYFKRIEILENSEIKKFLDDRNLSIQDFSNYVDNVYSRGQRYGQGIRELESPFRIADLEILLDNPENLPAIEAIVGFTESMNPDKVPFENYFAKTLGTNLGNMMNYGWECENFSHRQDYSLSGEMCDDSYVHATKEIEKYDQLQELGELEFKNATGEEEIEDANEEIEKAKMGKTFVRLRFLTQIYALSSNIKILQDEMRMRGKSKEEIESVLSDFLDSFEKTVDLERASTRITSTPDAAEKALEILLKKPNNIVSLLAFDPKGPHTSNTNTEVLKSQTPFEDFFDEVSQGLADRFKIERTSINEIEKEADTHLEKDER